MNTWSLNRTWLKGGKEGSRDERRSRSEWESLRKAIETVHLDGIALLWKTWEGSGNDKEQQGDSKGLIKGTRRRVLIREGEERITQCFETFSTKENSGVGVENT